jgi:protein-S-isoprenylcysteine O-methyltransferase Ste14
MMKSLKHILLSPIAERLLFVLSSFWAISPLVARIVAIMITGTTGLVWFSYYFWNIADLTLGMFFEPFRLNSLAYNLIGFSPDPLVQSLFETIKFLSGILGVFGIIIFGIAVIQLAQNRQRGESLITKGIYGIIRHPQNLAFILMGLGYLFLLEIRLGDIFSWTIFTFIMILEARWEEKQLIIQFPVEYKQYKSKTPFIIPYLQISLPMLGEKQSLRRDLLLGIVIYFIVVIPLIYLLHSNSMGTFFSISDSFRMYTDKFLFFFQEMDIFLRFYPL